MMRTLVFGVHFLYSMALTSLPLWRRHFTWILESCAGNLEDCVGLRNVLHATDIVIECAA